MAGEKLEILMHEINELETNLQLMQEEYMYYEEESKFYKKLEKLNFIDAEDVKIEELKKEYLDINSKWNKEYLIIKKYNEEIEKIKQIYNEKINGENYENLKSWTKEIEKRQDEKIELIYNMKKKELERQDKFIKVFRIIRNISICFAITFLILRNFIAEDFMYGLANNFSVLSAALIATVLLTLSMYNKNKKQFEIVENGYMSNKNMINALKLNIKSVLLEGDAKTIEEYGDKLVQTTKIYDKLYSLEMEKFNLKKKINPLENKRHEVNSKLYNIITSLDINYNEEHIEDCIEEFRMELEAYKTFKENKENFMHKYKIIWEEYRNKNRICIEKLHCCE